MSEAITSVVLAGTGLLRWQSGEEHVAYRVTVGLDSVIGGIKVGPPTPDILQRPARHGGLYLHMPEGRRLALNVNPNGHLSADGPIERSMDSEEWWTDITPLLPVEIPGRVTLSIKIGPLQVFQSHANQEEAEHAYRHWPNADLAEIRPAFGRPIRLK